MFKQALQIVQLL